MKSHALGEVMHQVILLEVVGRVVHNANDEVCDSGHLPVSRAKVSKYD